MSAGAATAATGSASITLDASVLTAFSIFGGTVSPVGGATYASGVFSSDLTAAAVSGASVLDWVPSSGLTLSLGGASVTLTSFSYSVANALISASAQVGAASSATYGIFDVGASTGTAGEYLLTFDTAGLTGLLGAGAGALASLPTAGTVRFSLPAAPVPEPATMGMVLAGLAVVGAAARRRVG